MVCTTCLKKLDNIHRFAKMAAEMQEKFRMLLAAKQERPKIKIKSLDDINNEIGGDNEKAAENTEDGSKAKIKAEAEENYEMNIDVVVEEVGDVSDEIGIEETFAETRNGDLEQPEEVAEAPVNRPDLDNEQEFTEIESNSSKHKDRRKSSADEENGGEDTSDSDRLVIQDEEKPNPSLLHSLLLKVNIFSGRDFWKFFLKITMCLVCSG